MFNLSRALSSAFIISVLMHDAYLNSRFLSNKSLMFPVAITPLLIVFEESDCQAGRRLGNMQLPYPDSRHCLA
jgi:hypothetical protein